LGEKRTVEEVNGGNKSIDLDNTDPNKSPSTSMEGWNTT
jgi:hypothetical protein